MVDVYFNDLQLNAAGIECNIPDVKRSKSFSNRSHVFVDSSNYRTYPISAESTSIDLEIVLRTTSGVWTDLLDMEKLIFDECTRQASEKIPIRIRTTTNTYLNKNDYFVFLEDVNYRRVGTDGVHHLVIKLNGLVYGISTANGGTIDPTNPWNEVAPTPAFGIGTNIIGSTLIGGD